MQCLFPHTLTPTSFIALLVIIVKGQLVLFLRCLKARVFFQNAQLNVLCSALACFTMKPYNLEKESKMHLLSRVGRLEKGEDH